MSFYVSIWFPLMCELPHASGLLPPLLGRKLKEETRFPQCLILILTNNSKYLEGKFTIRAILNIQNTKISSLHLLLY